MRKLIPMMIVAAIATAGSVLVHAQASPQMSFFITSVGLGQGRRPRRPAPAPTRTARRWRRPRARAARSGSAYLSAASADGKPSVNAKDRIGKGPWYNAKGEVVAKDLADLHGEAPLWTKQTALNEKGEVVNGRGDTPNTHDILTGSKQDGTVADGEPRWPPAATGRAAPTARAARRSATSTAPAAARRRPRSTPRTPRRAAARPTSCGTGGAGLFYCFAVREAGPSR